MPPAAPPPHTPLIALPVLVLDLETTGLDVRRDRIVQVGALCGEGERIDETPALDCLVNPQIPMPETARRIHGIDDAAVVALQPLGARLPAIAEAMAGRVVVGHHIGFDLAILRFEAARLGRDWSEPPALDTALLSGALDPALPDLGLERVADNLGVAITDRHSALGDCRTTAALWRALLVRLRAAGIRTLGEAQALQNSRDDLRLRQAGSGWDARPGEAPIPASSSPPPGRLDSEVFRGRVADLMSAPAIAIAPETTLLAAARKMVEARIGALLVADTGAPPAGLISERDLLRLTAEAGVDLATTPVSAHMSRPLATIPLEEMPYRALARMDRLGIRHLCVVDEDGRAVGMLSQRDLLAHRRRDALVLGDALEQAGDTAQLAAAYAGVPTVASALRADGLDGREVARMVSGELAALTRRASELAAATLVERGLGPAPAPWCVLVLGSGGRGESLLGADQDNALIHAGSAADDDWFAALGADLADRLDAAGLPRCKGGIMAANAEWRGTADDWRDRIGHWLSRARPQDLLNVDIFFDLAPVCGDAALARALREDAVTAAADAPPFLALLAQSVSGLAPRFGLFGRLRGENGRIDGKRDGLLPLVSLARALALRAGSGARSTPERLRDAAAAGRLPEADAEALVALQAELMSALVDQQIADLAAGIPVSNGIETARLGRARRASLTDGLKRLDGIIAELRSLMA